MIAIYDDEGRIYHVVKIYPPWYLEFLPKHGMTGLPVPQEMIDLKEGRSLMKKFYVREGRFTPRPANPLPDTLTLKVGEDAAYPEMPDCSVLLDGDPVEIDSGDFELIGVIARGYALHVRCFPMQDKTMKLTVVP